jgi:hypothetical protein
MMINYQILFPDTLSQFHLEPGCLLEVDVEGLHDGGVQVVDVVRQQVVVAVLPDVSEIDQRCFTIIKCKKLLVIFPSFLKKTLFLETFTLEIEMKYILQPFFCQSKLFSSRSIGTMFLKSKRKFT